MLPAGTSGIFYMEFRVIAAGAGGEGLVEDYRLAGTWNGTAATVESNEVFNLKLFGGASGVSTSITTVGGIVQVAQAGSGSNYKWLVKRMHMTFLAQ
jgi:hypothetical protein